MSSGAAALDLTFGRLTTTSNPQNPRKKIDLCGYHCPNSFATTAQILLLNILEWVFCFATEANN